MQRSCQDYEHAGNVERRYGSHRCEKSGARHCGTLTPIRPSWLQSSQADADPSTRDGGRYADDQGSKGFVIPNPMYGHWEFSFQHYDDGLDRATRIQNKLQALDHELDSQAVGDKRP
jgi:hypothetical protein